MTPKKKAEAMVLKFTNLLNYDFVSDLQWHDPNNADRNRRVKKDAKQCALIAVDEILSIDVLIDEDTWVSKTSYLEFWKEVKKELEKI